MWRPIHADFSFTGDQLRAYVRALAGTDLRGALDDIEQALQLMEQLSGCHGCAVDPSTAFVDTLSYKSNE